MLPEWHCDEIAVISESTGTIVSYIPINGVAGGVTADPAIHRIYATVGVNAGTDTE